MSLKPWLPVPMMPRVIRLLGATVPERPSAEPGMIVGKANPAAEARKVVRKKPRRDQREGLPREYFKGVMAMDRHPFGGMAVRSGVGNGAESRSGVCRPIDPALYSIAMTRAVQHRNASNCLDGFEHGPASIRARPAPVRAGEARHQAVRGGRASLGTSRVGCGSVARATGSRRRSDMRRRRVGGGTVASRISRSSSAANSSSE